MIRLKNILIEQNLPDPPKKSTTWHKNVVTRLLNNKAADPLLGTLEGIMQYYPQADPNWKADVEYQQVYDWLDTNSDIDTKLMNDAFQWLLDLTDGITLLSKTEVIKVPDGPLGIDLGYIYLKFNITLNDFNIQRLKTDSYKSSCTVNVRVDDVTPGGAFTGLYFDEDIDTNIEIQRAIFPIDKKTGKVVELLDQGINWLKSKFTGKKLKDSYSKTHMMAVYYTDINLNMRAEQFKGTLPKKTVMAIGGLVIASTVAGGLLGGLASFGLVQALRNIQLRITDNKIELGIVPRNFGWIDSPNLTDTLNKKLNKIENDIKRKTMHKVPIGNIYDTLPDSEKQRLRKASIIATAAKYGLQINNSDKD